MKNAFNASRLFLRNAVDKLERRIAPIRKSKGDPFDSVNIVSYMAAVKWLNLDPKNPTLTIPTIQSARDLIDRNANLKTSTGGDPPLARGGPIVVLDASGASVTTRDDHANTPGGPDRGTDCGDAFFNGDGPKCRRDVIPHEFFHMPGVPSWRWAVQCGNRPIGNQDHGPGIGFCRQPGAAGGSTHDAQGGDRRLHTAG